MKIAEFQRRIEDIYLERDRARGLAGTHMWFCEEVGELTRALRRGVPAVKSGGSQGGPIDAKAKSDLEGEFADVLAWLATLASIVGIDLEDAAVAKYSRGCPRCASTPCRCA